MAIRYRARSSRTPSRLHKLCLRGWRKLAESGGWRIRWMENQVDGESGGWRIRWMEMLTDFEAEQNHRERATHDWSCDLTQLYMC